MKYISEKVVSLAKTSGMIYLFVEFIVKILPFLAIPILTNNWSQSEFGKFSLYLAILPIMSILVDLAQRVSIKRFYISYPKQIHNFLIIIYIVITITFFLILSFIFIFNIVIVDSIDSILIMSVAFFYTIIEIYLSYLQISKQVIKYNSIYFIRQGIPYLIIIFFVLFYQYKEANTFIYIQLLFFSILSIYILFTIDKIKLLVHYKKYISYSLHIAIPIIPAILSGFILSASDKYMIALYYSNEEVALYSIAYTVGSILSIMVLALNKAWQPFILNSLKNNSIIKLKKTSRYYILFVFVVAIILSLVSEPILLIISNSSYLTAAKIIPQVIAGIFFYFLYTIYSNIAFYHKKMFLFSLPAIIAALVNLGLNMLLLPLYGYEVAATTTLISYFIEFIIIYIISIKYFKINLI